MNKKRKILNIVFLVLLAVTVFPTAISVIYCLAIDTGDAWENFGYGILVVLIFLAGTTLALIECEIYFSIRYFVFSDRKSAFNTLLHISALATAIVWFTICTHSYATDEVFLFATISYFTIKLIHLIYLPIKSFLLKR